MHFQRNLLTILSILLLCASCRHTEVVYPAIYDYVGEDTVPYDLYVLNEGNMGSNKAQIDFYNAETGYYTRNFYGERNPQVLKELGDVGNDIQVYGQRMYAVINCSHKVEVMDLNCRRIGQVEIPNCRYLQFADGHAYVSAYVGPIMDGEQLGAIYEIDTATLQITRHVSVGYQPDGLCVMGDSLYVCNSGGYRGSLGLGFDSTLSVIDLRTLTEVRRIAIDPNPDLVVADEHGRLWVSCRGDYFRHPASLLCIENGQIIQRWAISAGRIQYCNGYLYALAPADKALLRIHTTSFQQSVIQSVSDTIATFENPYALLVTPDRIYLTDAKNYVSSGFLYAFSHSGDFIFRAKTGDIPGHICIKP